MTLVWQAILPIRTQSEANLREFWAKKAARSKKQASALRSAWARNHPEISILQTQKIHINLTRIAPRKLDAYDNLPMSFKNILDTLADLILPGCKPGRADSKLDLSVSYAQRKGAPKEYAVEIQIFVNQNHPVDNSHVSLLSNMPNDNALNTNTNLRFSSQ